MQTDTAAGRLVNRAALEQGLVEYWCQLPTEAMREFLRQNMVAADPGWDDADYQAAIEEYIRTRPDHGLASLADEIPLAGTPGAVVPAPEWEASAEEPAAAATESEAVRWVRHVPVSDPNWRGYLERLTDDEVLHCLRHATGTTQLQRLRGEARRRKLALPPEPPTAPAPAEPPPGAQLALEVEGPATGQTVVKPAPVDDEPFTMPGLGAGSGELEKLQPGQIVVVGNPRKHFDEEKLAELARSISAYGILEPVVVNLVDGRYELIAGERRLRAACLAGLGVVPAIVLQVSRKEAAELRLLENLQREDLTPVEEGAAFIELVHQHGFTQEALAEKLGKSQAFISERMALCGLPDAVQESVAKKALAVKAALSLRPYLPKPGQETPEVVRAVAARMVENPPPAAQAATWLARQVWDESKSLKQHKVTDYDFRYNNGPPYGRVFPMDKPIDGLAALPVCVNCPMRRELQAPYEDRKELRCLSPSCWEAKQKKVWNRLLREWKADQEKRQAQATPTPPAPPEPAGSDATAAEPAPAPAPEQLQLDPSPPLADADPVLAAALRELAAEHWEGTGKRGGEVEHEREAYLPLETLLEHWEARRKIGASQMPPQLGGVTVHIPEAGVWVRGWSESEPTVEVAEDRVVLECSGGRVLQALPVGMVYYRVRVEGGAGGFRGLQQLLIIAGGGGRQGPKRHLVVTGSATVLMRKELVARWRSLMNMLPAVPEAEGGVEG